MLGSVDVHELGSELCSRNVAVHQNNMEVYMNSESNYDVLAVLKSTRDLLSDKSRWTQKAWVRDADGTAFVDIKSDQAVSFCLVGAIHRCAADEHEAAFAQRELSRSHNPTVIADTLVNLNDNVGYEGVMDVLDRTIERLEHDRPRGDRQD